MQKKLFFKADPKLSKIKILKKTFVCSLGILAFLFFMFPQTAGAQARSFNDIFPTLAANYRAEAFAGGAIRTVGKGDSLQILPSQASGIDIPERIRNKGYAYLSESVLVVPYGSRTLRVLDAYNALGKVQNLKGILYNSHSKNEAVPLFEEATRVESDRRNNPIPDPLPASSIPSSETVYIRLKDVNFGNTYYKADITPYGRGILYSLTNYRNISYLFFTVMKEGNFSAYLYMEPLREGMLVYSAAGSDVSNFVAGQVDIPSAISKRLAVFVEWVSNGLRGI